MAIPAILDIHSPYPFRDSVMAVELSVHFVFGFTKDVQAEGCDPLLCLLLQALRPTLVVTGAGRAGGREVLERRPESDRDLAGRLARRVRGARRRR